MILRRFVKRKEVWVPTCWGWALVVFAIFALTMGYVKCIHSFLSFSKPVPAQILAVDGWSSVEGLELAASEFKAHGYVQLVVFDPQGHWIISTLEKAGINEKQITQLSVRPVSKDRTFAYGVALDNWLQSSGLPRKAVNVMTQGVHARRSLLLFRKALGPDAAVGVISYRNPNYDPDRWWGSSEGFKSVIDETIAYLYTELFFIPARTFK
jgi:hypothetical protein